MNSTTMPATDRSNLSPQLYGYASMHDAITRDCARLETALGSLQPGDPAEGARFARWFEYFEGVITHHHHAEDDVTFPVLVERDPTFDPDGLTVDHHRLDEVMEQLRMALAALASNANGAGQARSARAATDLRNVMVDHLVREEDAVFHRMLEFVTPEEHAAMEVQFRKGVKLSLMTFALPWILEDADPKIAAYVRADLPLPLRALNTLLWDRSYQRRSAPVREGSAGRANI